MRRILSTWCPSRGVAAINAAMQPSSSPCGTTILTTTTCSTRYHQTSVYTVTLSFVEECVRAEQWEAAQSSLQPVLEGIEQEETTSPPTSSANIRQEMEGPLSALLETSNMGVAANSRSSNGSGDESARSAFVSQLEAMINRCRICTTTTLSSSSSTSTPHHRVGGVGADASKVVAKDANEDDDELNGNLKNLRLYDNEDEDGSDPGKPRRQHHHQHSHGGGYQNRGGGSSSTHLKSPFALDSALGWKEDQIGHGWKNPSKTKNHHHHHNNNNNKGGGGHNHHKREFKQRPPQTEAGAVLSETLHLNRQLTEILRNLQEIQAAQELVDAKRHAEQRRRFPGQPNLRKFTKVSPVIQERMRSLVASSWSRAFTLVSDQLCASRVRQQISAAQTTSMLVAGMVPPTGLLLHPVHTSTFSLLMGILSTFPGEAATKTAAHECIADYYKSKFNHHSQKKEDGGVGEDGVVMDGSKVNFEDNSNHNHSHYRNKNMKDLTSVPPPDPYDPNSPTLTAERRCMLVLNEYGSILTHQREDRAFIDLLRKAREGENKAALRELISTPPTTSATKDLRTTTTTSPSNSNTTPPSCHLNESPRIVSVFPSIHMQLYQRREELLKDITTDYTDGVDEIIKATVAFQESNSLEPSMSLMKATADASKKISSSLMATVVLFSPSFKPEAADTSTTSNAGAKKEGVEGEGDGETQKSSANTQPTPASAMITPSTAIGAIVALTKRRQWESAIAFIEEMRQQHTHSTNPTIRAGAISVLTHLNLASHVAACVADGAVYCRRGAGLHLFNRGLLPKYPNPHGAALYAKAQIDKLGDEANGKTSTTDLESSIPLIPSSSTTTSPADRDDDDEAFLVEFEKTPSSDGNNNNGNSNHPGTWRSNIIKEMRKDPNALPPDHFKDSSFSHWEYALGVLGGASGSVSPGLGVVYGLRALRTMGLWERAIWVLQTYNHHLNPPTPALEDNPLSGVMGLGGSASSSSLMGSQHKMAASAVMLRENSRMWVPPQGINAAERLLRDPVTKF